METKDSITARPWFICPTWAAVMPLLADAIARNGDYGDEAAAARAELMRLAAAMDAWNNRTPIIRNQITAALERIDEDEFTMAGKLLRAALANLEAAE
jgi:restriction endonuclease